MSSSDQVKNMSSSNQVENMSSSQQVENMTSSNQVENLSSYEYLIFNFDNWYYCQPFHVLSDLKKDKGEFLCCSKPG